MGIISAARGGGRAVRVDAAGRGTGRATGWIWIEIVGCGRLGGRSGVETVSRRVALVTGGSRGIGLGIAQCLLREEYDLAICGLREEAAVGDTVGKLRA